LTYLVPTVFILASADRPTAMSLTLVCRASHQWVLPVLYHSVELSTPSAIEKFHSANDTYTTDTTRVSLVCNLWIGPICETMDTLLLYGSTYWPIAIIDRILWTCTNVQHLYIINLGQSEWYRLEHFIPASVEHIHLGPVHGGFVLRNLLRRPRIRTFTSALSFMRGDEVRDLVMSPDLRYFRRIMTVHPLATIPTAMLGQLACVADSKSFEKMEFVFCGPAEKGEKLLRSFKECMKEHTRDPRVTAVRSEETDWVVFLHKEFLQIKADYVGAYLRVAREACSLVNMCCRIIDRHLGICGVMQLKRRDSHGLQQTEVY
ncbi:hypothetical protein FISHEDRAFT_45315, partial [Fistulina hepatica ATCC 64428]